MCLFFLVIITYDRLTLVGYLQVQKYTHTGTSRQGPTDWQDRAGNRQKAGNHTPGQASIQPNRFINTNIGKYRYTERQTDGQTDKQTDRKNKQTDKQQINRQNPVTGKRRRW